MDYNLERDVSPRTPQGPSVRLYGAQLEYKADTCPPIDSPEFLKKFPLDPATEEGFRRIQAAMANGYGD